MYIGRTLPVKERSSEYKPTNEDIKLNIDDCLGGQPAYVYKRPAGYIYNGVQ